MQDRPMVDAAAPDINAMLARLVKSANHISSLKVAREERNRAAGIKEMTAEIKEATQEHNALCTPIIRFLKDHDHVEALLQEAEAAWLVKLVKVNYEKAVARKDLRAKLEECLPHNWEEVYRSICPECEPKHCLRIKSKPPSSRGDRFSG
jgi:hypothetical protein